eukprot:388268-Prymnesium_polylepis.4
MKLLRRHRQSRVPRGGRAACCLSVAVLRVAALCAPAHRALREPDNRRTARVALTDQTRTLQLYSVLVCYDLRTKKKKKIVCPTAVASSTQTGLGFLNRL